MRWQATPLEWRWTLIQLRCSFLMLEKLITWTQSNGGSNLKNTRTASDAAGVPFIENDRIWAQRVKHVSTYLEHYIIFLSDWSSRFSWISIESHIQYCSFDIYSVQLVLPFVFIFPLRVCTTATIRMSPFPVIFLIKVPYLMCSFLSRQFSVGHYNRKASSTRPTKHLPQYVLWIPRIIFLLCSFAESQFTSLFRNPRNE